MLVFSGDIIADFNLEVENRPIAGIGTYVRGNTIKASIKGKVVKEETINGGITINVIPKSENIAQNFILNEKDIVIGRITRINYNQAFVDILMVGEQKLAFPPKGVIRREDIRSTEIDKVSVPDFFKPFDIVKAQVVSMGDTKYYYLSTSNEKLGVIDRLWLIFDRKINELINILIKNSVYRWNKKSIFSLFIVIIFLFSMDVYIWLVWND